ncbi:MAG: ATPase [Clostridiales bacterium]|nr:ATPase [Clostridiales bacterium]
MDKGKVIAIREGKTALGIELGSTRIKAVLIGENGTPLASGNYNWENKLVDGLWTYSVEDIWKGMQGAYHALKEDVAQRYEEPLTRIGAISVSAMMHGYLPFDEKDQLLVPFRTWRNTMTEEAAKELTALFQFNIPQRWSVAHLYQAILNQEKHVEKIAFLTTLAGYVHWQLTGEKVIGVGDGSGMFPVDSNTLQYDNQMLAAFDHQIKDRSLSWKITEILPTVLQAGEGAGKLSADGAKRLDPSGDLQEGTPFFPPEGDAGTGMVSTNSVSPRTGNVSAGTSIFAMIVLEKALSKVHEEIDMVATPDGKPVAMVHCNNCTSDINAWAEVFMEFAKGIGADIKEGQLFEFLFTKALEGETDGGGLLAYNYLSGEHTTGFEEGRPLLVRSPNSRFTLANFMRTHLYAALATLKIGMDILLKEERVALEELLGHGGFFKTERVGQQMLAGAINVPVAVMETAGEGGAWGAALLAGYGIWNTHQQALGEYLQSKIFSEMESSKINPLQEDVEGFAVYMERFIQGFPIERAAVDNMDLNN